MAESSRHAQEDGNDSSSSASRKRRHSGQSEVPRKRLAARTPAIDEPRSRKIGDERKFGTVSFNGMTVTLPRAGPMFGSQPRYQDPHVSHARRQRSALERDDSRLSDQSRNMVDGESRARGSSIPVRGRRSNRLDNAESKDSLDVDQYSTHRDRRGRPVHSEQSSIRADPPDFLEKLVLNVVRHAELAHEEAKLQAMQCGRDDEARHIQCEKVRRRRRKQDQRLADLCWYAEIAELRDNLTLRRMGEDFFIRLSRMIRQYLELRKQHIAADEYYTCLRRLDDKQDGVLGAKIQNVIRMQHDDLDRLVRIDRQIGDAEHEMASVEPDFLGRERRLERLREVQRVQETELYKLAIPVLVSEGLVDRENVVVGLQLKTPQNSPPKATSPPRDKREQDTRQEPPISHLERSVVARDKPDELDKADGEQEPAEGEYRDTQETLIKYRNEFEKSRETNRKLKVQFQEHLRAGKVTGSPSDYDRFLYLCTRDDTDNLKRAESRFQYAKVRAAEIGALPKDQSSDFGQYPEDREPGAESEIQKRLATLDRAPIEDWQKAVDAKRPEGLRDPEQPRGVSEEPEVDAFTASSLKPGDSLFRFASGKMRTKIDKYGAGWRRTGSDGDGSVPRSPARGFCNSRGL